jgi:hypothetical protein
MAAAIIADSRDEDNCLNFSCGVADMTMAIVFLLPDIEVGQHAPTVALPRREYGSCENVHGTGLP